MIILLKCQLKTNIFLNVHLYHGRDWVKNAPKTKLFKNDASTLLTEKDKTG